MDCRKLLLAGSVTVAVLAIPGVALAQGKGKGKKPPGCNPNGGAFPVLLQFDQHPSGDGPAIYSFTGGQLSATINSTNVASQVEDPDMTVDLPLHLDFPQGAPHLDMNVDPWIATSVYDAAEDTTIGCHMFGMVPDDATQYRMRIVFHWHEDPEGTAIVWGTRKWDVGYKIRFSPNDSDGAIGTWVDAVRRDANTWVLTTRTDSDPEHYGNLRRDPTAKKEPATFEGEVAMPFQLTITCVNGDCPDLSGS